MINARQLHPWLVVHDSFPQYMRRCTAEHRFDNAKGFFTATVKTRGRPRIDHLLTFEAAVIPQDREGETMIDARQLYDWLRIKDRFHQWMRRRVAEYGFEEGPDFCTSVCKTRGRPRTDYLLTLDTAKELAMVERTEPGEGDPPVLH
nr:antA/AntB antirepressor family protein [Sphingobium subterraneum]